MSGETMTAARRGEPRTIPHGMLRVFWALHRGAYRATGGRFGLTLPEAGKRFGMMRLHTIGRRSGDTRTVIVGYIEDGPNLVTIAMNGWAAQDPAWWLNLQANPHATVDLRDGRRAVTARPATESERNRVWPRFDEYPGYGGDIDLLAARRPEQTALVVFEPRESSQ